MIPANCYSYKTCYFTVISCCFTVNLVLKRFKNRPVSICFRRWVVRCQFFYVSRWHGSWIDKPKSLGNTQLFFFLVSKAITVHKFKIHVCENGLFSCLKQVRQTLRYRNRTTSGKTVNKMIEADRCMRNFDSENCNLSTCFCFQNGLEYKTILDIIQPRLNFIISLSGPHWFVITRAFRPQIESSSMTFRSVWFCCILNPVAF